MTHAPLLLDTNILLHLVRNKELGQQLTARFNLADTIHRPLISIVSVGEIWALADPFAFGAQKRQFLHKVLAAMVILDINDESVIDSYVLVDRAGRKAPGGARVLSKNDLWIAATAKAGGATLLTMDKDFLCLHPAACVVHYVDSAFPHS